jgi:multidrug efflux pump subunit AcrB
MKRFIDYFVDNTIVVNLITILIIVMGALSLLSLNRETFPNVDFNYIVARVLFPGNAPEDVEKLVVLDVERSLKEVDGIEELNTMSSESGAIISIKVDPDYNVDDVLQEVKDAFDRLTDLPSDVEEPYIFKITNKNRGLMNVALYGEDEIELRQKAKALRDFLERDKQISRVEMTGYRNEVMDVQVDIKKLEKYDMTLNEVVAAISDRQVNISAGNIKNPNQEKIVRTLVENETKESVESIVIRSNDIGDVVRVKDVANVFATFQDKSREDRADKRKAIFLDILTKSSADVLKSATFIKKALQDQSQVLNFDYKIYNDFSFYVERRLGVLTENAIQGIILVIICLVMFMNMRVSIITALGAPFAFLVAFIMMDGMGLTINLISMFGLIMVLGMLVDDSIILAEQYYQNLEKGLEPKQAAKQAAYETLGPITATVLTTMVAFGSLFYVEGMMGKFLWAVPAVVIIALIASWLECFIILPGHLLDFASKVDPKSFEKDKWYRPWKNFYEKSLRFFMQNAKLTVIGFLVLFGISIATIFTMRFELFPSDDATMVTINIKGKVGTPFEITNKELLKVEDAIFSLVKPEEMTGVRTMTGYQSFKGGRSKSGDHYGSILLELTMQDFRKRTTKEIVSVIGDGLKDIIQGYEYSIDLMKGGPPQGKPVNIELYGDDLTQMLIVANKIQQKMLVTNGIITAELDYEIGKRQILVQINEVEARRLGVSNKQIALELRRAFEGEKATTIKKNDEDMDILVRFNKDTRSQEEVLTKIRIANNQGRRIALNAIASFKEVDGAYIIRRYNRKRAMQVAGDIDLKKTTSLKANKDLKPYLDELMLEYPSMSYEQTGESKDTKESVESFKKALFASMFVIFIMLVIQFSSLAQPLIIMSAIPFGVIGVVASFKLLGMPIGFMALMGMLGLVGVVINDSIVLVTFINRTLKEEGPSFESLIKATVSRFRPVVLTTITTVVGLLPVAHMPGGDPFLKPMATSFAYGLLFSSAITLIFVPACYKNYVDFPQDLKRLMKRLKRQK